MLEDGHSHHSHSDRQPQSGDGGDGARWQAMTLAFTDAPDSDDSDGPRRVALLPTAVLHNRLGATELVLGAAYDAHLEPPVLCRAAAGCSAMFDWYVLGSGSHSCGSQSDRVHYLLDAGGGGKGTEMSPNLPVALNFALRWLREPYTVSRCTHAGGRCRARPPWCAWG
jgi:hypothetical protein